MSAPTLIKGGFDKSQSDYVSEWTEWEGVDYNKLFEIVRHLTIKKHFEVKHG